MNDMIIDEENAAVDLIENDASGKPFEDTMPMITPPVNREDALMMKVIETGDIGMLEKFLDLRAREDERQAKKEFDEHFALLQGDLEPIKREKKGDKAKYAPLEAMQRMFGPVISSHGFAFSWDELPIEDGGIRVIMTISRNGHDRTSQKDLPRYTPDTGNTSGRSIMNALQAEGTRSSYGRRYTFKAGFGIAEEDEDTDGGIKEGTGKVWAEEVLALQSSGTDEELHATWKRVYPKTANDPGGRRYLTTIKDARRKELTNVR